MVYASAVRSSLDLSPTVSLALPRPPVHPGYSRSLGVWASVLLLLAPRWMVTVDVEGPCPWRVQLSCAQAWVLSISLSLYAQIWEMYLRAHACMCVHVSMLSDPGSLETQSRCRRKPVGRAVRGRMGSNWPFNPNLPVTAKPRLLLHNTAPFKTEQ